jgi:ABC-type multidrug transport system fused ATPase/permease subunit
MGAATVVTLLGVAIAVAAIALYLINICMILNHVSFTVGTVIVGVKAIAQATEPLAGVIRDIQQNVSAIDEDLEALVTGGEPRDRKPSHSLAGVGYKLLPGTRGW